jgi:hypothetical protein
VRPENARADSDDNDELSSGHVVQEHNVPAEIKIDISINMLIPRLLCASG